MKKEAILKINKMGKVGQTIAIIANVFMALGIVAVVASIILCSILPKDLVVFKGSGFIDLSVNVASIGKSLSEEDKELVLKELHMADEDAMVNGQLKVNDVEYGIENIEVSEDAIMLTTATESVSLQLGDFVYLLVVAFISIVMIAIIIYFIQRLCKAFRYCESPFEEKVIKSMQHLAIAIIPWALVSSILNTYISNFITNGGNLSFEINIGQILVCFVIFALTYVFKYGAVLQQESDETL